MRSTLWMTAAHALASSLVSVEDLTPQRLSVLVYSLKTVSRFVLGYSRDTPQLDVPHS